MTTYGLSSLTDLLNHPCLVRNRLAEALYGEAGAPAHVRLASRARGRHRFREEEVAGLLKLLPRLARKLEHRAGKLAALDLEQATPSAVQRLLDLPELNAKPLIENALGKEHYFSFYDRTRARGRLPEAWRNAVADELLRFAETIRTSVAAARQEARRYPYSYGKGGGSHMK